jgi:thiol-disulfide isomerase/thioredoxin
MKRAGYITILIMVTIVALGVLYVLFLQDESEVQQRQNTPAAQALLPPAEVASFTTLAGEPTSVSDDFGSIMVITTWASWCPLCAADFPALGEIAEQYSQEDVVVYALNRGEDPYSAERFLATIEEPTSVRYILDPSDFYFTESDSYAMPETVVYDKKGNVLLRQAGELRPDEIRAVLDEALK